MSFHEFPSNKKLKKAWEDRIRREEFETSSYSHVCSKHFLESDYAEPNLGTPVDFQKKRLKRRTIPSVNLRGSGVDEKVSARNSMTSKKARMTEDISSLSAGGDVVIVMLSSENDEDNYTMNIQCLMMTFIFFFISYHKGFTGKTFYFW